MLYAKLVKIKMKYSRGALLFKLQQCSVVCLGLYLVECYRKRPWKDINAPDYYNTSAQSLHWQTEGSTRVKDMTFHMVEALFYMK